MTQSKPPREQRAPPVPNANPRLDGLDTLRAAAILLVFMYHYQVFVSGGPTFGWASTIGWVGVDLFFVLSGYLIANQIFAGLAAGKALSLKAFYARRLLRTLPNYWVVLALYFLFPVLMGGREPPALWRFLSFTQNIQLQPGTAFSHAWSLCIEEQFYLVLPATALIAMRWCRSIRLAWLLLGGLIAGGMLARALLWARYGHEAGGAIAGYHPNIYYATLCRADEFLPGVAVAMLKNFHHGAWERLLKWSRGTLALGLVACAVVGWALLRFYVIEGQGYGFVMTTFGYSLVAMAFAVLLVAALSPGSLLYRWRVPGAAALAAWSYAIYLVHKPLAMILQRQLAALGVDAGSGLAVLVISAASLLGGWLLYRAVETPFMTLRDRLVPTSFPRIVRRPTTAPRGAASRETS